MESFSSTFCSRPDKFESGYLSFDRSQILHKLAYPHFTSALSRSDRTASSFSKESVKYSSNYLKNNSSTCQVAFSPENYIDAYSGSVGFNRATPSTSNSYLTSTSPTLSISSCSGVIQYTNENKQNAADFSNINCHGNGHDALILIHDSGKDAIISSHAQVNDAIVSGRSYGFDTGLENYRSRTDSGANFESDSGSGRNNDVINMNDGEIAKRLSKYFGRKSEKSTVKNKDPKRRTCKSSVRLPEMQSSHHTSSNHEKTSSNLTLGSIPRPPYTYTAMIGLAITSSPEQRMTLQEIYKYILTNFEYYRFSGDGWKNSVRHNLSLRKCFLRISRQGASEGKGGYWTFTGNLKDMFPNNNFRRTVRRKPQGESKKSTHILSYDPDSYAFPGYYRSVNPNDRNWSISRIAASMPHSSKSTSSGQQIQDQTIHDSCMQIPLDPIVTTSARTSITYPSHSYVPPPAAFPGHCPEHRLQELSCFAQPTVCRRY